MLRPDSRLPTHRELARQLGISVQTVSIGYREAERRGYLRSEVGRGTFVRNRVTERAGQFMLDHRTRMWSISRSSALLISMRMKPPPAG